MNRIAILLAAVVVIGVAAANVILGQNLILPLPVATERGAGVPWYITWAMIWVSVGCAIALAIFLVAATTGKSSRR